MRHIDRREKRKRLNGKNQGRSKRTHEREPISRAHQHVDQGDRPGQKHENLEEVGDRTAADRVATHGEKRGLQNETGDNREETETARLENSRAQRKRRPRDGREVAKC